MTLGENATIAIPMPDAKKDIKKIRFRPDLLDTDKTKSCVIPQTHKLAEPTAKNYRTIVVFFFQISNGNYISKNGRAKSRRIDY